jgi:ABC-type sugar transport system permease subunit
LSQLIRPRSSIAPARQKRARQRATGYTFVLPAVGLTVLFSIYPLIMVVQRSLQRGTFFGTNLTFAGLGNYRAVLATGGGHALVVTAVFTLGFVAACMVAGLAVALILDVRLPGLRQVRAFFIIPIVVPPVATAFIWFTFFQPNTGLLNRLLVAVGLPQVSLSTPTTALIAVIAFGAWQFFGEVVLLYLAGLKSLPEDLLEAASVDGAGAWGRLRYIRLPLLRRQTVLISIIATLTGLQTFTQIYVLTDGGPQGATQTALYYVYQQAFGLGAGGSVGLADAMAVILFAISLVITIGQLTASGRREGGA